MEETSSTPRVNVVASINVFSVIFHISGVARKLQFARVNPPGFPAPSTGISPLVLTEKVEITTQYTPRTNGIEKINRIAKGMTFPRGKYLFLNPLSLG